MRQAMPGTLNKFGSNAGSLVDVAVIAATPVVNNRALIYEFGSTMEDVGADGRFQIQVSRDGFALDIRTRSRIVMPVGGTFLKVLTKPVIVQPGESFRVVAKEGVIAEVSAEVHGETDTLSIED
jgi:hypothetical protein